MAVNMNATRALIQEIENRYVDDVSEIGEVYSVLYANSESNGKLLACMHKLLDDLFDFMNHKSRSNNHFNAGQSRELLSLIADIKELQKHYEKLGKDFSVTGYYKKELEYVEKFLEQTEGSLIPEDYKIINVIKDEPAFVIHDKHLYVQLETKLEENSQEQLRKIEEKLNSGDYDGSITNCRTLLELSLGKMYKDKTGKELRGKFTKMWKDFSIEFQLDSKRADERFAKLLDGISQVIEEIAILRNIHSDSHGNKRRAKLSKHHAVLIRNATITIVDFLFHTAEHQKKLASNKENP